jgi:hypothetical protein
LLVLDIRFAISFAFLLLTIVDRGLAGMLATLVPDFVIVATSSVPTPLDTLLSTSPSSSSTRREVS